MAFRRADDQITDPATQANVEEAADAPTVPMGNLYQATAEALADSAHNATTAQDEASLAAQADTVEGVATLLGLDTASTGKAGDAQDKAPATRGGAGVQTDKP